MDEEQKEVQLMNLVLDSIHTHHQFSIRILVNNVWETTRTDRCDRLHYEVEGYESDCK